jgi:peptide/nickel transport system permease protein
VKVLKRILWRLGAGVGVVWGVATLTFAMINLAGGDTAIAILGGPDALPSPETIAQVRRDYDLDRPLPEQYLRYLHRIVRGDLGESYRLRIPVARAIRQQFGETAKLASCAALVALAASISVSLLTARRAPWIRSLASGSEIVASSMPSFVLGILLLLVFSFRFHVFPASGEHGWKSMVLPTLTLALPITAILTQVLRQELDDILEQPFIMTARSRGMSEAGVRLRHALRHALIPLMTLSGFLFANLFGGAVIAETLFARRGLGRLMADAATTKDVPLVVGITLLAAAAYVVINLLVDVLNAIIDPRIITV